MLIRIGHFDALDELFFIVNAEDKDNWIQNCARKAVLNLTDFHGLASEMASWYDANKYNLVYDPALGGERSAIDGLSRLVSVVEEGRPEGIC